MNLPLRVGFVEESAQRLANKLRRIRLGECIKDMYVREFPVCKVESLAGGYGRKYEVVLEFHPIEEYPPEACITWKELENACEDEFIPKFQSAVKRELKRMEKIARDNSITKVSIERILNYTRSL